MMKLKQKMKLEQKVSEGFRSVQGAKIRTTFLTDLSVSQ
jgi:hypothetical protein